MVGSRRGETRLGIVTGGQKCARAIYEYQGGLGAKYDVPSYWVGNVSLTVAPQGAPWTATFFARNLFDKEYDLTRNFFTSADIAQPGRPRTIGVRLNYQY